MANSFVKTSLPERDFYENKYRSSRMNLLLVVVFTAVNLLLLVTNSDTYFLFSAFVPYMIASVGMFLCGRFPEEYYIDMAAEDAVFFDNSLFVILLVISVVLTLLYLLAWFMSRKQRVGWLIFALVFFGLDTLGLLWIGGISLEALFDILFHAWVIYYLVIGIRAHYKLKKLPPEEAMDIVCEIASPEGEPTEESPESDYAQTEEPKETEAHEEVQNSNVIREAAKDVKHRILLEKHIFSYDICYRRVKHTNELVINGKVYDEIQGIMEYPHTLKAWIDGHYVSVGYTGTHSFITFDGDTIAKKLRIV